MRERANRVRSIPLCSVLRAVGAEQDREDKARWHTRQGVISVTGMKFMNWNRAIGGGGAIDLVIHLYGLDFQGALAWLRGHFPRCECASAPPAPKPDLKLPVPDPDSLTPVERYLVAERRIRPDRIKRLIQSSDLYADHHANAVFVLRSADNVPVGAELRGSGPRPWRGMAPGSRKDLGYFSVRESHVDGIILCESAIDAISCSLIHPRRWCLSTAGARPAPSWLPAAISHGLPVYCGFDADCTGDDMADAMIKRYPAIKRLRPPAHDWNDSLPPLS